jgi:hypothetical protein
MIGYLILALQIFVLVRIGGKFGFDSGPFINFGLIIFGQIYLVQLYCLGLVEFDPFNKYALSLLCGLIAFLWVAKRHNPLGRPLNRGLLEVGLYKKLHLFFITYLALQIIHVWLTIEAGGGGARVVVAKSILPFVVIHDVLQGAAYMFLAINLMQRKYFYFLIISITCLLSGSKQSVLMLVFEISFICHLCFGKRPFSFFQCCIIGIIGFSASALFFYQDEVVLQNFSKFIEYRGDIYYYLFDMGFRERLYDAYNWASYFLHHSQRMIGLKVYDGPIGTMLFSLRDNLPLAEANGGPITPFFVVFDVLFHDPSLYIYLLASFFIGYLSARIFTAGCLIFTVGNIKCILIGYWMMQGWFLVTDPTVFSYKFTPIVWILVVPFFVLRIMTSNLKFRNSAFKYEAQGGSKIH